MYDIYRILQAVLSSNISNDSRYLLLINNAILGLYQISLTLIFNHFNNLYEYSINPFNLLLILNIMNNSTSCILSPWLLTKPETTISMTAERILDRMSTRTLSVRVYITTVLQAVSKGVFYPGSQGKLS